MISSPSCTTSEEKILVNVTPRETRVAWVENGILQEVWIERTNRRGLVGNIYRGRVMRVLPGMQAAFIDIGLEKAAFLHVSDVRLSTEIQDQEEITKLLHEGQEVLVQVAKDPLGTKGARVSMNLTLPSHLLVYLPKEKTIGVSQRIESEEERQRLRRLVDEGMQAGKLVGGFIVRTVAEGIAPEVLIDDVLFLQKLWRKIDQDYRQKSAPCLVHEDLPLFLRVMRDVPHDRIESLRVDSRETFQRMHSFIQEYIPSLLPKLEHYQGERPIFDLYTIEDDIQKALERKVPLKSGGYLIIDQTEAMTTIDVNTGGFVGSRNLEETIFRTNLEAALVIARQLRLRNLGGIIILDFIDMEIEEHKLQVLQALERALAKDRVKSSISQLTSLGLVEMTRKRTRESLEQTLCEPCPTCQGRGMIKSIETVIYEIFRELTRMAKQYESEKLLVIAHEQVVTKLLEDESANIAELESFLGRSLCFQSDTQYTLEQFDAVMR